MNQRMGTRLSMLAALLLSLGCGASAAEPVKNRHELLVTEKGFEPKDIAVKAGELVTLVVTRKTNDTCANEIIIDEPKVNAKLPLNVPVTVTFTPTKTGELKYGCAMNKMIGGVISVR